jgi:hypothetical protein
MISGIKELYMESWVGATRCLINAAKKMYAIPQLF